MMEICTSKIELFANWKWQGKFSVEYWMFINIQWEWKLGDTEKLRNRGWWDTLPVEFKQISIVLLQGSEITDPKQDLTRMSERIERKRKKLDVRWKDKKKEESIMSLRQNGNFKERIDDRKRWNVNTDVNRVMDEIQPSLKLDGTKKKLQGILEPEIF